MVLLNPERRYRLSTTIEQPENVWGLRLQTNVGFMKSHSPARAGMPHAPPAVHPPTSLRRAIP